MSTAMIERTICRMLKSAVDLRVGETDREGIGVLDHLVPETPHGRRTQRGGANVSDPRSARPSPRRPQVASNPSGWRSSRREMDQPMQAMRGTS